MTRDQPIPDSILPLFDDPEREARVRAYHELEAAVSEGDVEAQRAAQATLKRHGREVVIAGGA